VADVVGRVDDAGADAPRAPGRQRSHYAPGTPLDIVLGESLQSELETALAEGGRVAVLARTAAPAKSDRVIWRAMPDAPAGYGRVLYAELRALDAAGVDRILAVAVPAGEAWAAIADRLMRAAARGETADGMVEDTP
jgi:L-threonylcarbamoyladenylate synthase